MPIIVKTKSGLKIQTVAYRYDDDLREAVEKLEKEQTFMRIDKYIVRISEIEAIYQK